MREQPTGSITLVFTDIEGSTRLLHELGEEAYRDALAEHRRVVREAFAAGYEVDEEGDAFFYAFPTAGSAVAAVEQAMRALEPGPIRIRVGIHTGEPILDPPKYIGLDVPPRGTGDGRWTRRPGAAERVGAGAARRRGARARPRRAPAEGPVRAAAAVPARRGRVPAAPRRCTRRTCRSRPTQLVGREREVEDLLELLRREDVSVVTLTGAGGSGKTRLVMQAAAEAAEDYVDGVWFVGLATVTDVDLVVAGDRADVRLARGERQDVSRRARGLPALAAAAARARQSRAAASRSGGGWSRSLRPSLPASISSRPAGSR